MVPASSVSSGPVPCASSSSAPIQAHDRDVDAATITAAGVSRRHLRGMAEAEAGGAELVERDAAELARQADRAADLVVHPGHARLVGAEVGAEDVVGGAAQCRREGTDQPLVSLAGNQPTGRDDDPGVERKGLLGHGPGEGVPDHRDAGLDLAELPAVVGRVGIGQDEDGAVRGDGDVADTDLTTLDLITTEQPTSGGRDTIHGDEGDDLAFGGTDLDRIRGDDGDEAAETASANRDVLFGDHGRLYPHFSVLADFNSRNFFAIDTGDDDGGEGDVMYGEEGDDVMLGQQGDDEKSDLLHLASRKAGLRT